jgi:hypothetical protein
VERLIAGTNYSKALRLAQPAGAAKPSAIGRLAPVARDRGDAVRSGRPKFHQPAAAKSVPDRWDFRFAGWWGNWLRLTLQLLGLTFGNSRWDFYLIRRPIPANSLSNKPSSVSGPVDSPLPAALQFARIRHLGLAEHTPDEADQVQALGNRMRDLRREQGLSRMQTAQLLACDVEFVVAVENGYGNLETAQNTLQRLRQMLNA